jgi:hypothetical protein
MQWRSTWLAEATEDGGLVLPGWPADDACDLILRADQIEVHAGEEAGAALAWDEFVPRDQVHGRSNTDRFWFDFWIVDRRRFAGIALRVEGRCRVATLEVIAARSTRRNRWELTGDFPKVPLVARDALFGGQRKDAALVDDLCTSLAARPELRSRLDEPGRVAQLIQDLQGGSLGTFVDG